MEALLSWRRNTKSPQEIFTVKGFDIDKAHLRLLDGGEAYASNITPNPVQLTAIPPLEYPKDPRPVTHANSFALAANMYLSEIPKPQWQFYSIQPEKIEAAKKMEGKEQEEFLKKSLEPMAKAPPPPFSMAAARSRKNLQEIIAQNKDISAIKPEATRKIVDDFWKQRIENEEDPDKKRRILYEQGMMGVAAQNMLDSGGEMPEAMRTLLKCLALISPNLVRQLYDPAMDLEMGHYAPISRNYVRQNPNAPEDELLFHRQMGDDQNLSAARRKSILTEHFFSGIMARAQQYEANGAHIEPVIIAPGERITPDKLAAALQQAVSIDGVPMTKEELNLIYLTLHRESSCKGLTHTYKIKGEDGQWRYASTARGSFQLLNETTVDCVKMNAMKGVDIAQCVSTKMSWDDNRNCNLTMQIVMFREYMRRRCVPRFDPRKDAFDQSKVIYSGFWHYGSIQPSTINKVRADIPKSEGLRHIVNNDTARLLAQYPLDMINRPMVAAREEQRQTLHAQAQQPSPQQGHAPTFG